MDIDIAKLSTEIFGKQMLFYQGNDLWYNRYTGEYVHTLQALEWLVYYEEGEEYDEL